MNSDFPTPSVPLSPLLGFNKIDKPSIRTFSSVLDIKNKQFTTSGRTAIALLLEHENIGYNDQILIPAFHCEAMVAPAQWAGAAPVFYRIHKDTSPDITDIKNKLNPNVKAIMVTHYFGFVQNLNEIRAICNQHNLLLIEDCAHALFGSNDQPIGRTGDYAIASTMKFLPVYEGGLLCSANKNLNGIDLTAPGITFQLKSLINTVENAIAYKRLGIAGKLIKQLFILKNLIWNSIKKQKDQQPPKIGPSSSEGGFGLDSDWVHKSCSITTKLIIHFSNLNKSAQLRRQNYQMLHQALANLPNSHPLFDHLPANTVPFVYPLYVENPQHYFRKLKMLGVPIWRFGEFLVPEVTEKTCPVSVDYSAHVFQFPCHQSLTNEEIDWMINQITQTLKNK